MGKHKYIESPEKMWELFEAYRNKVNESPIEVQDFVGKDGEEVYRKKQRPLTMEGFQNYCEDEGVITTIDQYFSNQNGLYNDYVGICSRIRRNIRQNQIEGGMAGIYNPSITQRLNNLVEKSSADDKSTVTYIIKDADEGDNSTEAS